jgi:hypothetical protein
LTLGVRVGLGAADGDQDAGRLAEDVLEVECRDLARPQRSRDASVRHDKVDKSGKITWRHRGRLYSIGIGRTHDRTRVIVLVQDLDIRIVDAATGELLRELVLDTTKRYQGTGRPPGPTR